MFWVFMLGYTSSKFPHVQHYPSGEYEKSISHIHQNVLFKHIKLSNYEDTMRPILEQITTAYSYFCYILACLS